MLRWIAQGGLQASAYRVGGVACGIRVPASSSSSHRRRLLPQRPLVVLRRPLAAATGGKAPDAEGAEEERPFVSVDKRTLYEDVARLMRPEKVEKSPMTPLGELLQASIKRVGPISLADFMDVCLAHPEHGYYMHAETAKIGKAGDFVTAPEISQMFGELLGVWTVATWEKLGLPGKGVRLVEMGPGKGTLMTDLLRVARTFPPFHKALGGVHMVETSRSLREVQKKALGAVESEPAASEGVVAAAAAAATSSKGGGQEEEEEWERGGARASRQAKWTLPSLGGLGIDWHDDIRQVPVGGPLLIVAQELLDALPVHQFEFTKDGWRERLVDMDEDPETPHHFKLVLAEGPTPAVAHLEATMGPVIEQLRERQRLAKRAVREVRRRRAARAAAAAKEAGKGAATEPEDNVVEEEDGVDGEEGPLEIGTGLEVCPLGLQMAQHVAERVARTGGAALFVDYGEGYAQGDSLRGLKRHAHVDALSEPGRVDLSTDVDFGAIKTAVEGMEGVRAFGPMPQGQFLSAMGIEARLQALLESDAVSEKQALHLYDSYRRLVDPDQMGRKYKVLALVSTRHQGPAVAFEDPPKNTEKGQEKKRG